MRLRLSSKEAAAMLAGFHSPRTHHVGCLRTTGPRIVCICPCVAQSHEQVSERLLYPLFKILSTLKYLWCRGLLDHHHVLYLATKAHLCMFSHGVSFCCPTDPGVSPITFTPFSPSSLFTFSHGFWCSGSQHGLFSPALTFTVFPLNPASSKKQKATSLSHFALSIFLIKIRV